MIAAESFTSTVPALAVPMSCNDAMAACNVLLVQGMSIVGQLNVSVVDIPGPSQSTQDTALTIEAKLKHMHDFMLNYMPNSTVEE